ncbi:hypothetical protein Bca4012_063374 [Brassica carinata]
MSEVRWNGDELPGLLLSPFNSIFGGTANSLQKRASPPYLNKHQEYQNLHVCQLQLSIPYPNRESDLSTWEVSEAHHHHVKTYNLNFTSCSTIIFSSPFSQAIVVLTYLDTYKESSLAK